MAGLASPADKAFLDYLSRRGGSEEREVVAGSVRVVNLKEVEPLGAGYWRVVADQVRTIAEEEIRKRLGAGVLQERTETGDYLFCFTDTSLPEAEARMQIMSEDIRARIDRDVPDSAGQFGVEPIVASVERAALLNSDLPPFGALAATLEQIRQERLARTQVSHAAIIRSARVLFRPAWSRRPGVASLNRCTVDSAYQPIWAEAENAGPSGAAAVGRLDAVMLTKVIEKLHAAVWHATRETSVMIPLHYWTLHDAAARNDYLTLFDRVPREYAQYLNFEVRLPAGGELPLGLKGALDMAAPVLPNLFLSCRHCEPLEVSRHFQGPIKGLLIDLVPSDEPLLVLERRLRAVTTVASASGLITCVDGAHSIGLADVARRANVDFVFGNAVHGVQEEPTTSETVPTFIPMSI